MQPDYSIRVYKQYFNFASAHFMIFENGEREPLHGHNYRVQLRADAPRLEGDMVFDFLNIKPIVKEVCDSLDHKLLIPKENPQIEIFEEEKNFKINTPDGDEFSFPKKDVLLLPILNTSAERIAIYLAKMIDEKTLERFHFRFSKLEIEVEETPGQSAVYVHIPEQL